MTRSDRRAEPAVLILIVALLVATALRLPALLSPLPVEDPASLETIAAAIGLSNSLPEGGALATWIFALAYTASLHVQAALSPDLTVIEFCAGFLNDPAGFALIARVAVALAGVATVFAAWLLGAQLVDRHFALIAALVTACHPVIVDLSDNLDSSAFALLFLLVGLLCALTPDQGPRGALLSAIVGGALIGLSAEAMPELALSALIVVAATSAARSASAASGWYLPVAAIGGFVITVATAGLSPSLLAAAVQPLEFASALVAALLVASMMSPAGRIELQPRRRALSEATLAVALIPAVTWVAVDARHAPACATRPADAASAWIRSSLPAGSVIVVHPDLHAAVNLPRSARSWKREASTPAHLRHHPTVWSHVAAHAAATSDGDAYDVIFAEGDPWDAIDALTSPADERPVYVVTPEGLRPHAGGGPWLLARFHGVGGRGLEVWATSAHERIEQDPVFWIRWGGDIETRLA